MTRHTSSWRPGDLNHLKPKKTLITTLGKTMKKIGNHTQVISKYIVLRSVIISKYLIDFFNWHERNFGLFRKISNSCKIQKSNCRRCADCKYYNGPASIWANTALGIFLCGECTIFFFFLFFLSIDAHVNTCMTYPARSQEVLYLPTAI